ELLVVKLELLAQERQWVVMLADVPLLLLRPIHLRVADVVADEPVRVAVQEDRSPARAGVLERLLRSLVDLLDVLPVDLDRRHAERLRAFREIAYRRVLPLGRGLGPLVVLEHEDSGDLPELREVQRLVEGADVR